MDSCEGWIENISVLVPTSEASQISSLGYAAIQSILSQAFPELTVNPAYLDNASSLQEADILIANFYSTLGFVDLQRILKDQGFSGDKKSNSFISITGGTGALNPLPIKDTADYVVLDERNLIQLIGLLAEKQPRPWEQPSPIWTKTDYITLIMPTLSCIYKCAFCQLKNQNNGKPHYSDVEVVRSIISEANPERILVHSANILRYPSFDKLAEMLEESKAAIYLGSMNLIDVNAQSAAQLFSLHPRHTIAAEKDTDVQLYFGLESGSARVLKKMRKPLTPEIALQKAKILSEAGFHHLGFYLVVGYPGTEEEDFDDTARLLNSIADSLGNDKKISVKCTPFIPHLGTQVRTQPARSWVECTKELDRIKNIAMPNIDFDISDPFYYLSSIALIRGGIEHSRLVQRLACQRDGEIIKDDDGIETLLKELCLPDLSAHLNGKAPLDLSFSKMSFIRTEDL